MKIMRHKQIIRLFGFGLLAVTTAAHADEPKLPTAEPVGRIETVTTFTGPMPTGVTVSREGRIFVNFPRWGDAVEFTVAELKDGKPVPYPDAAFNRFNKDRPADSLVSVQSVVVDPDDRLWLLDTGSTEFGPTLRDGPKLVGVDLKTNKVFQTIHFPRGVALEPDQQFLPIVEGRPLMNRPPGGKPTHMTFGSDGIAISHDGKHLYYCPLSSRRLYRVRTDALIDEKASEEEVAKAVEDLGDRGFASDGLESDDKGRLYLTGYEDNAILRRDADGSYETLAHDPRLLWPDTLSVAADGYLYIMANQLHRQAQFHGGKDLRRKPYTLFRVRIDGQPVLLR